jgi:hypothetical protein
MPESRRRTTSTRTSAPGAVRRRKPEDGPPTNGADGPRHIDIARRAYELYELRGGEHGRDWEDWLQAERELRRAGMALRT